MNAYEKITRLYDDHRQCFRAIEADLLRAHGIPEQITRDTIKRILLSQENLESQQTIGLRPRLLRGFFLYHAAMAYFLVFALIGEQAKRIRADLFFEEWGYRGYEEFYCEIHSQLATLDVKILATGTDEVIVSGAPQAPADGPLLSVWIAVEAAPAGLSRDMQVLSALSDAEAVR